MKDSIRSVLSKLLIPAVLGLVLGVFYFDKADTTAFAGRNC